MASTGKVPNTTVTEVEVFKQRWEWRTRYADNRFKQLTLWFAAMTLLITAGFHRDSNIALGPHPFIVPLLGILLTSAFWVMEVSSTLREIEVMEGLKPYEDLLPTPKLKHWTFFNHTNVTLILYIVSFALWAGLAGRGGLKGVYIVLIILVGAALLVYTAREYWHLWCYAKNDWKW